jgi:putative nucleotidyltransferase with HDIG domain
VALESGDTALARERALVAAPLAVAQSLYDVAASTYSVLYQIAYDVDDDATASREYLRRMRDLGIKSGTLRLESYVMLCLYELEVEAGDEAAIGALDRQLAVIDKHDSALAVVETLIPSKALQAAWSGDFRAAQRLLRSTAEHQATPARKALCWAQIGLYCAAADDTEPADTAVRKAENELMQCVAGTAQFGLTLLILALAAWVSGNVEGARHWTSRAGDTTIGRAPRLRALRDVAAALVEGCHDAFCFSEHVPGALARLRAASFGGMAKLIEALPHPFTGSNDNETIGGVLAQRELAARFAAAVKNGDAGSLQAWLAAAPGSIANGSALTERFDRWATVHAALAREAPARFADVRRQLAIYRPRAPAFVRFGYDIDATLSNLLESLDVAAPLMAEHSRAVAAWCERLARALGLSEDEITFAARCGLIHDIGKLQTPPEILNAPRTLSPQEWAIMRDHAAAGARIIETLPLLVALIPSVRGHHERLDGRGYPDGLGPSAISLTTRIVTVADCFNAMIGRRPYRLPLSPADALDELERKRGTQFDAEVATPVAVYDTYADSGWIEMGGTSVSAPIIAGVYALAANGAKLTGASSLYANPAALYAITSGTNGTCAPAYICAAGGGYNGLAGLGSPNGIAAF